ncbi:hypothetical protein RHS01_10143 [Rhizoctonia solani]|uniref:Reverse transcriptase domain-containing protein n=1 Tax=Rhizoctonia solani TaxID=456999 RepID=A0A8H7I3S9_9AGAM|nr:hypothetical protein RHS01_10143 [Rhizoctonia solani]
MATRSRSTAHPLSPLNQGELGPTLPAATNESANLEPKVFREISLSHAISLLLGLQNQVIQLKRELEETKEANKEAQDWMGACAPHCLGQPTKPPITFAQPTPVWAPLQVPTPAPPLPVQLRSPIAPQPAASLAAYQAPVKVDHPDAYMGKIGNESWQWLTRMMAWVCLNQRMFPTNQEAHPHLNQLGSHRAIIQTVEDFRREFLAAFGNPDATQAAKRQITHLTQTGTCAEYITKFRTIAMDLDWNNAALCGQFAQGLHWEVSCLIATQEQRPTTLLELQNAALVINNALRKERASHPPKGNKPGTSTTTPIGGQVPASRPPDQDAYPAIPTLSPRRSKTAAGLKAFASNAANQVTNLQSAALVGRSRLRRKASKRKPPRLAKSLDPNWEKTKDLPTPQTVTVLDGLSPQAGKIWKKANLTFSFDGKRMTETFLICNTGSHAAILGLKWLGTHNPEIDWNMRTLTFPHAPPEHVAIAKEEEADKDPLEGVPPEYHQYAKYDRRQIRHTQGLAQDKLKAGKICPSKLSISSPVMFVPKKDGSCCLVVNYHRLNNRTKKNVYPLPRPDNLMAQLCGAKVFTRLDLQWGYNNVQVKEGDKWKTAFCTKYGLYKSLVMTFGLTNAPTSFQHFMNNLFKDLLDVCVIIYLDDILIYSKDDASHTQHIHKVLQCLMKNQLFCKASKCTFHVTTVEYLGIIVLDKGLA